MIAVVLVAGRGTRLAPLLGDRPKALLEVGGQPILERCLESLSELDPERLVVVVGSGEERFVSRVGESFGGIPVEYAEQPEPTGTAAALLCAEPRLGSLDALDALAVMYGDNVFSAGLAPAAERHLADRNDATLLVERLPPELARQGVCQVEKDGRVSRIAEHPSAAERALGVVSAGAYLFGSAILDACRRVRPSANGELELPEAINLMIGDGRRVRAVWLEGWRVNVNRPEDLMRAERHLRS